MLKTLSRLVGLTLAIGALSILPAAGDAIGMASGSAGLTVNHSLIWGNATLFDGSLIETASSYSQLKLDHGVQVRLAPESRATVHDGRLVLDAGQSDFESASDYEVQAHSLRVRAAMSGTEARVRLSGGRRVMVAAVHGAVRVTNSSGMLIATLEAGNTLNFEPQTAGAEAGTRASGCLLAKSGSFILAERTNNVILELTGSGLSAELGNAVEITGRSDAATPHVAEASQVIKVIGIRQVSKGGCGTIAKKIGAATVATAAGAATAAAGSAGAAGTAGAAGAAAATTAAGIGAGTVAVIGGVATAATIGGLAAAGSLPGQRGSEQTPASR
jgi:hypothetical protein